MIVAIELPTPRILKKKFKKYINKERVAIYTSISFGITVICLNDIPVKLVPIAALIYCGIAYEVIGNSNYIIEDQEFLNLINNNRYLYDAYAGMYF